MRLIATLMPSVRANSSASKLRLERDALAVLAQAVVVDRLKPEEDVLEAERLPELEHLLVAQEHVAARLQIIVLADALPGDCLADGEAVLRLDEGDVIDDEHAPLLDRGEVVDHAIGRYEPVAAAIERPGAAERAVPRDSRARIRSRPPGSRMPMKYLLRWRRRSRAGRSSSRLCTKAGGGPSPSVVTAPGHFRDRVAVAAHGLQQA